MSLSGMDLQNSGNHQIHAETTKPSMTDFNNPQMDNQQVDQRYVPAKF
jgi:hypothetical protein